MKQIILGTAGHIDHGKTSLIKALTGIETDRLKEEKARGITIELGFASMDLPSGQHIGIVDVPGHEKFVRNMVAGATGIDLVTMVIAADEGVMPQTREHMEICALLGIKYGMVVLTKTDMVDEEWLELVTEDVKGFLQGTFLEEAPLIPVSSMTGEGIDTLIKEIDKIGKQIPERSSAGLFRLPVDRVFTMKGFGTVITGTVASGRIKVGDPVTIYPFGITSKVRGIQVHSEAVDEAASGMRAAINFQGLEKAAINRGDVVATPEGLKPNHLIDARFHYLGGNKKPLKNRTRVRLHTGTSEILGNLILLDRDTIDPGDETVVQIRLESPVSCVKDDKYVIRSYSPVRTIGGGQIINPIPRKHKRFKDDIIEGLKSLVDKELPDVISFHVTQSGFSGVPFNELKLMTNCADKPLNTAIQNLLARKIVIQTDKESRTLIHQETLNQLIEMARQHLTAYHEANPLKEGMPREELKSKLPDLVETRVFTLILNSLISSGDAAQQENSVRLSGHTVELEVDMEELSATIFETYKSAELTPPYFKALCKTLEAGPKKAKDVLLLLINEKKLIRVKDDLYFEKEAMDALTRRLQEFFISKTEMSTADFKDITGGVSRKYLIPLLEYFDSNNMTIRVGDVRHLRGRNSI